MFKENFSHAISNLALALDQNGPEIGFWAGLGLMLGGAGWAVYASLKRAPEIKDEFRIQSKDIAIRKAVEGLSDEEIEILMKELKKKRTWNYIKAYIGPALMEIAGVSVEVAAHIESNDRMGRIAAELVATTASYGAYRKRVAEFVGDDQEKALYFNKELKTRVIEDKDEEGNVVGTHEETYLEGDDEMPANPYVFEFSAQTSGAYSGIYEYDKANLQVIQMDWDKNFYSMPYVYLNDVLRSMQMEEETVFVKRAGWLNPKYYHTPGYGHIDFRATEVWHTDEKGKKYCTWLLDFNCDGDIMAMMLNQQGLLGEPTRLIDKPKQ